MCQFDMVIGESRLRQEIAGLAYALDGADLVVVADMNRNGVLRWARVMLEGCRQRDGGASRWGSDSVGPVSNTDRLGPRDTGNGLCAS